MTSPWENGLNIRKMQVSNLTGPGVRRSKRPLLTSRSRCKYFMETIRDLVIRLSRSSSVRRSWNVRSVEGVTLYCHFPECHVTFGRGRLHIVWWDPHKNSIELRNEATKTSSQTFCNDIYKTVENTTVATVCKSCSMQVKVKKNAIVSLEFAFQIWHEVQLSNGPN